MKQLVFATNNKHKVQEVAAKLGGKFNLLSLADIGCMDDIAETGHTFAENALIKSRFVYDNYQLDCFSDDSGLEVDALNGEPGIYSARYAGMHGNHDANIDLLLQNLKNKTNRTARFKTVISLVLGGKEYFFEGTFFFVQPYDGFLVTNLAVQNNLFDLPDTSLGGTNYNYFFGKYGGTYIFDHNAWNVPISVFTNIASANDILLTNGMAYQAGPLGNFYQPANSTLINAGSINAGALGLYHYTVATNLVSGLEVPDGTNIVSIGYHYVATDAYGNPLDSNGNGIPDYIEDANGSGQPLTITLLAPTNGASFAEPATIPMQATVFDWSGTVTNVEFYNGSAGLAGIINSPFNYNWPVVAAGGYTVMAGAYDNMGATAFSVPVSVTVTNLCSY